MEQLVFKIGTIRNPILIDFKEFNGQKLVDIRKCFIDKNDSNNLIPTKKGISLNANQLNQIVEVLNSQAESITEFFGINEFREIGVEVMSTMGRSFQCRYENNKITVDIDEELRNRMSADNVSLFIKLVQSFYSSLSEVLEQEDEKELILDVFNHKLSRQL
jgi:hypothetical protein